MAVRSAAVGWQAKAKASSVELVGCATARVLVVVRMVVEGEAGWAGLAVLVAVMVMARANAVAIEAASKVPREVATRAVAAAAVVLTTGVQVTEVAARVRCDAVARQVEQGASISIAR